MLRLKYFAIVALVTIAAIIIIYPSAAQAGTYVWQSCSGASQDPVNAPDPSSWSPVANGSGWSLNSSGCKSVGGLGILFDSAWGNKGRLFYSNTGPMNSGNYWAGFSLHAPGGTVFSSLSWRQRILTTGGGNKCVLATSNIFSGAYTLAQNCFGPSTNWQDSGWVSRSANVSAAYNRDLLLVGACIVAYGNCSVYSAGNQTTGNALHTAFDQINAVLSDTTAPAMSGISRPGDGAWIRGGWNTTWSASDAMGIKTHRFLVDDAVGDSNSFCDIPWYGNYYGTSSQPCPNPGAEDYSNADFSIDTSAYSDATHTLKLQSSDATDVWASSQSTIKTDNSPPDPPSFGVGITEGAWVSSSSSNFEFSAQDTQSGINSYQCQVDDGSFSACQSPKTLTLPDGPHNICVQAFNNSSDSDGVLNSSEGCTSFQIDRVTPTTTMNRPAGNIAQAGTFVSGSVVPGESGLREIVFEARQAGQPNWQTLCDLTESQNTLYSCEIDGVSLNIGDTYNLRMKSTSNSGLSSTSQTYDAVVLPDTAESGSLPANSNLPTIEGVLSPDETLTSTTGNWTGDPTFSYLWQTSDSGSGDWITASGDGYNTSSYVVPLGDMGKWLRVQVTGTNNSGGTVALSLTRGRVSVLPSALEAPALIGTAEVGSMISVSDGLWIGNPVPTMSYQWQVSVNGNDWLDANGAGNATNGYLPQISDSGHYLRVVVSGNNWGGTVQEFSNISEAVGMSPSAQNPVIEGTATVASRLNVTQPIIEGSPNPDLNYTWQSSSDNLNWNDIGVGNNYLLTAAESAKHVRIKLTLDNSFGSSTVYSQSVLVETITENTAPPTIGASAKVAVAILANAGTWTGSPSLTYQWQISSNGTNWTNANGVIDTSLSYSPVHLDAGSILRLKVTANGTTVAHSNSLTVNESPSLGEVTLSGNARIGATLTASSGSWRGYPSPTFTYQWQTSTDGFSFSDISGAESLSYLIKEADIGNYLRLKVTGSNNQGSADIYSPISRIVSRIPTNDTPPTISNQKVLGQTITSVSDGAWTSYPDPSFTYQWERCDLACAPIVSETGASYQLARADVGHKIKLTVTADNQFDQVKASSDQSATIEGVAANTSLPVIEGVAIIGGNLHVTDGLWNAWPDPSYSYDWQSCQGETCSAIANQDSSSYSPTLEDNGKTIKASVTATNTHGQTTVTSQASVAVHVTASPPINNTLPAISGVAETGQTYTSVNGNWSSDFEISYSYNWQRCDISGCQTIIGAIQNSYLTDDADAGKEIRLKVTATNADGATEASSAKSATIVQTKPTNQSAPVISGSKTVTSVLTVNNGTWLGFGNSYQTEWQRCNPSCATISAGQQYTLTTADLGANIKAIVTASNAHGSNSASSQPFGPVEAASVPPGGDTPGGGLPGGDTPGGGLPGGDTPGGGLPGGDTPGGGLPGGDTPGGGVCMGTSAISASKASVAGSKISFKAVPASWSQTTMRLQVQASKPLSFSWMYDNKIIATISKSKSSKASLPAKTIGQHYLVLTAKSGKKIIKIKKTIIVLLCPQSKSLLPAIKTINTKVGNGKFSIIIAKNYSANKPGLWLLKGRGSAVWKLDGKIISKKNSTLISPETLKIGSHKISLKITNKKKSKTIIIAINAQ